MKRIVGIGANCHDNLITLTKFPKEDTKLRAQSVIPAGGGPCATGLAAAAKLGGAAAYIGYIADDSSGAFLIEDLKRFNVSVDNVEIKENCRSFVCYVMLSEEKKTRTIVFDKGTVPPLALTQKHKQEIEKASVLMVDGNDLDAAVAAAEHARTNNVNVLYDAGGLYDGVERLLPYSNILIPSEEFALGITGERDVSAAAKKLFSAYKPDVIVITCGAAGGIMYDGGSIKEYPAFPVSAVDTNGAGDVFHGAFAFCLAKGYDFYKCCVFSSAVSALKCTRLGSRRGVPSFGETIKFLKERGIDEFEKDMG